MCHGDKQIDLLQNLVDHFRIVRSPIHLFFHISVAEIHTCLLYNLILHLQYLDSSYLMQNIHTTDFRYIDSIQCTASTFATVYRSKILDDICICCIFLYSIPHLKNNSKPKSVPSYDVSWLQHISHLLCKALFRLTVKSRYYASYGDRAKVTQQLEWHNNEGS